MAAGKENEREFMINPLDELKKMNSEIELAADLSALKPIYFRLKHITENFPDDFDVFFAANETRQHLITRGAALQQGGASAPPPTQPFPQPSSPAAPPETAAPPEPPMYLPPEPATPPYASPFPLAGARTGAGSFAIPVL